MTVPFRAACLAALLALGGCNTLPAYAPAPAEKLATVRFLGSGVPYMCVNGARYKLTVAETDGDFTTRIPAGKRVMLWRYLSYAGYQVTSSCSAALSVVAAEGSTIIVNSGLDAGKCFIEAVREDKSRETGVRIEPSVGAPTC